MEEKRIEEMVVYLLRERLQVNPIILIRENYDIPLTGRIFGLYARDLVYLFFEIEKYFRVQISVDNLSDGSFNTIKGIIKELSRNKMYHFRPRII